MVLMVESMVLLCLCLFLNSEVKGLGKVVPAVIVLMLTVKLCSVRCRGLLGLSLSSLFCEPLTEFWHLEYLHNYACCSSSRYSQANIPEIREKKSDSYETFYYIPISGNNLLLV